METAARSITYFIVMLAVNSALYATVPQRHMYPYGSYVHQFRTTRAKPKVERVTLYSRESDETNNTITRRAVLVRYPNAQANIVISHGFMCNKFDVGFLRSLFPQGRFNFLTFDFRAHGEDIDGQVLHLIDVDSEPDIFSAELFHHA